jgi:E3 ubiquitin-protein ligase TRIP12
VGLLHLEHNPDIMLLAARALTFMADVLPQSTAVIVRHGAVPALCARLLSIEYIDLAEQSLTALEKLSTDHAGPLLSSGGLLAVSKLTVVRVRCFGWMLTIATLLKGNC